MHLNQRLSTRSTTPKNIAQVPAHCVISMDMKCTSKGPAQWSDRIWGFLVPLSTELGEAGVERELHTVAHSPAGGPCIGHVLLITRSSISRQTVRIQRACHADNRARQLQVRLAYKKAVDAGAKTAFADGSFWIQAESFQGHGPQRTSTLGRRLPSYMPAAMARSYTQVHGYRAPTICALPAQPDEAAFVVVQEALSKCIHDQDTGALAQVVSKTNSMRLARARRHIAGDGHARASLRPPRYSTVRRKTRACASDAPFFPGVARTVSALALRSCWIASRLVSERKSSTTTQAHHEATVDGVLEATENSIRPTLLLLPEDQDCKRGLLLSIADSGSLSP